MQSGKLKLPVAVKTGWPPNTAPLPGEGLSRVSREKLRNQGDQNAKKYVRNLIPIALTKKKTMGRSRYKLHEPWYPYLLTSSFVHGLPLFSIPEIALFVIGAIKHHQSQNGLKVYAWCIMENHFHLIAEYEDLKMCMQSIKSYTAKQILDLLKSKNNQLYLKQLSYSRKRGKKESAYQVWQEGYHPKQISTEKMLHQKINYVHFNPVKRGYMDKPEDWRYSSARDYSGGNGFINIHRII